MIRVYLNKSNKMIKKLSLTFSFLLIVCSSLIAGTTYYSIVNNGTWTTGTTWSTSSGGPTCTCTPSSNPTGANTTIFIETNISLTGNLYVSSNSTITVRAGDTLVVTGDGTFANGSTINVEPTGAIIFTGNLTNNNNSNNINIDGFLSVGGNFSGGNGSKINGTGAMNVAGSATTSGSGSIFGSTADCPTGPCNSSAASPLPIEIIYFNATQNEDIIELAWATASEINNDFFSIERSKDAQTWEEVLITKGAGNSNKTINYFEIDNNPKNGLVYYRLKQTDVNGEFSYSNIVPVKFEKTGKDIIVYPNPNEGIFFNVDLSGYKNEQVIVVIRDIQGRQLYSKVFIVNDNITTSITLEQNLPKGTYLIIASSEDKLISKKLIVE